MQPHQTRFVDTSLTFCARNLTLTTDCPPDRAIPATFSSQFKTDGVKAGRGWGVTSGSINYGPEGMELTIAQKGDSPTVATDGYLFFGQVEVRMRSAPGTGIVSSIVLQSEDLDEVDWEMLGGKATEVQTNYFGKGNTTTYDRGINFPMNDVVGQMHTYTLDWTKDTIVWSIDGKPVRTLNYADAVGGKNFPQTPMNVRIGSWAGGDSNNNPGVIQWAGGKTNYTKGPFTMFVESVKVRNDNPGAEYVWTDRSGSFQSIQVKPAAADGGNEAASSAASGETTAPGAFYPIPPATSAGAEDTAAAGEKPPCTTGAPVVQPPAGQTPSSPPIETPSAASEPIPASSEVLPSEVLPSEVSTTPAPSVPAPGELITTCTRDSTILVTVTVPEDFTPPPFSRPRQTPPYPIFSPASNATSVPGTAPPVPTTLETSGSELFIPSVILTDTSPPSVPTGFPPEGLTTTNFTIPLVSQPPEATGAAAALDPWRPACFAACGFILALMLL